MSVVLAGAGLVAALDGGEQAQCGGGAGVAVWVNALACVGAAVLAGFVLPSACEGA
ncbi:hypothetical protein AB0L34_07890 [Micromonospora sp. NPDC052213]|uniref:hypothetical protein n=1 Tax=Micromonospora sp. NPDC052213 TaxID=3155812 RepID=UPI003442C986